MLHNTLKTFLKMRKDNGEKGGSNMNNQQMMELTTVEKSEFEQLVSECTQIGRASCRERV